MGVVCIKWVFLFEARSWYALKIIYIVMIVVYSEIMQLHFFSTKQI